MNRFTTICVLGAVGGLVAPLFAGQTLDASQDGALQDLYQSYKNTQSDAPEWLVAALFPQAGDDLGALSGDDDEEEDGDGHNPANAKIISALPYSDHERTTNASGANNAVPASAYATPTLCDETGTFYTSTARDRSYRIQLTEATRLDIDLCNAGFDCVLGVFEAQDDNLGACVARDDDGCGANRHSKILSCLLPAGSYFIVVDGSGTQTGVYTLDVDVAECADSGYPNGYDVSIESEVNGMDNNGGCADEAFESLVPGSMLGGGTWADQGERDTDAYELVLEEDGRITATLATGCVPMEVLVLAGNCQDDEPLVMAQAASNGQCQAQSACLPAGVYHLVARPQDLHGFPAEGFFHYGLNVEVESCSLPCEAPLELLCGDVVNANAPTVNQFSAAPESCTGGAHEGFDQEYALTITQESDVALVMDNHGSLDAVLLLRTDCADASTCIAGADATTDGEAEVVNARLAPGTYFIIADFVEGGEAYTLEVLCTAVEQVGMDEVPEVFQLHPAAPNPFNPSTQIAYALVETGPVQLKVYDMLGHEVATLVDGLREAGNHVATFDGRDLASGVYLYTLRSAGHMETHKMVLAK